MTATLDAVDDLLTARDALDLLERSRHRDGTFAGPSWSSKTQPAVLDRTAYAEILTRRAREVLGD